MDAGAKSLLEAVLKKVPRGYLLLECRLRWEKIKLVSAGGGEYSACLLREQRSDKFGAQTDICAF